MIENLRYIEELEKEIRESQELLAETNESWAAHIKEVHNGLIPTACHRCWSFIQARRSNKVRLANDEAELARFQEEIET